MITLSEGGNTLFDIYPSHVLLSPWYRKKDILILGIACGKQEAMETAGHMAADVYRATGGFEVRQFFDIAK